MRWLLVVLLSAMAAAYARWIYRRAELPVAHARSLSWLRAGALVGVVALLVNPPVPWGGGAGRSDRWVLLDVSVSMTAAAPGTPSAWEGALARARALQGQGWRVVAFGAETDTPMDLDAVVPDDRASRLAPALTVAAEGGARAVRVLSDFRLEDEVAVRAVLSTVPLSVEFEPFGDVVRNVGVSRFTVPDRRSAESQAVATVEVHGGAAGERWVVDVLEEGVVLASVEVEAPAEGLRRTIEVPLPPSAGTGLVRYEARVAAPADAFASDDRVPAYARVGTSAGAGVVLVSFAPDWEPRALLPVLERTTGLSGAGFLQVGTDRFVTMGRAIERGAPVDGAEVRRVGEGAELLVLHGVRDGIPSWALDLAGRAPRRIVFPSNPTGTALFGLETTAPRPGSWFAVPELPASPLSGALAGAFHEGLPPLRGLMVPPGGGDGARAFSVRRPDGGGEEAALLLRTHERGRDAVVLANGFWRWAARESGRDAYEAVWSGVAGWLLREPRAGGRALEPVQWVVGAGAEVDWRVPEDRTGYGILIERDGTAVADTTFAEPGISRTGPFPAGEYRYVVRDPAGDSVDAGRFDVSDATTDMAHPRVDPDRLAALSGPDGAAPAGHGRPFRTLPWPYLWIIGCLCAEWVGRRRSGLR